MDFIARMDTRIVHCKKEPYDVLIDRTTKWGNPYSHLKNSRAKYIVATRKEAIEKYKEYLLSNKELMDSLHELEGKILGCWCKPKYKCHGDILIELLEIKKFEDLFP